MVMHPQLQTIFSRILIISRSITPATHYDANGVAIVGALMLSVLIKISGGTGFLVVPVLERD